MPSFGLVVLVSLTGFAPPTWNAFQVSHDERLLGITASTGPMLVDRFRANMLAAKDVVAVEQLVDRLGAANFREREKAHSELLFWPAGAEAILKRHENDPSLERRRRVRQLLERGMGRWSPAQAEAAARLIRRAPTLESVDVLLAYLPFADEPGVRKEVIATLREFAATRPDLKPLLRDVDVVSSDPTGEISPTLLALDHARTFFSLVGQGDRGKLADLVSLPFSVGNTVVLTSTDQRDDFFRQAIDNFKNTHPNATLTFLHAARGEEYLRFAVDSERDHFAVLPADELRAVHVRMRRDWRHEELGVILVRVTASGVRVVGMGQSGLRAVK